MFQSERKRRYIKVKVDNNCYLAKVHTTPIIAKLTTMLYKCIECTILQSVPFYIPLSKYEPTVSNIMSIVSIGNIRFD
jgi:hypothetical protein